MITFFNIVAALALIGSIIRFAGLVIAVSDPGMQRAIKIAELQGKNPLGAAVMKPLIVFLISVSWIAAQIIENI